MALAIVTFESAGSDGLRFRIDIGKNRFYSYAIGGDETSQANGLETLQDPVFTSTLLGPLPESSMGRTFLVVPEGRFDSKHRAIQLASYRTRDRVGPAISKVIRAPLAGSGLDALPPPAYFQEGRSLALATGEVMISTRERVENVPYSYQRGEVNNSAQYLEILTAILPQILPILTAVLGTKPITAKPVSNGNGSGGPPSVKVGDPESAKLINELIKQISSAKATAQGIQYQDPETNFAAARSLSQYRERFSEAKVAPALLAAIPALMPILEKVLNPETMKSIMENLSPAKLIGTVSDAVANFAKIGLEDRKNLQEHLERLNPGVANPELYKLLESLSTGEARLGSKLSYRRDEQVKLSLGETQPQSLYGRTRLAYHYGQDLTFPLSVDTPAPLRKAILEITLKEAATLKVIYETSQRIEDVRSGAMDSMPKIGWNSLSKAKAGEDYLLTFVLCWEAAKGGQKRGTALSQMITLVPDYAFDRVEDTSPALIPLSNPTSDGEFWHKVWERTFEGSGLTRVRLACDYCYVLDGHRNGNARMETKSKSAANAESMREEGKLKSGMILSPDILNKLTPRLSDREPLTDEQLEALRSPDFADRFNQAARTQVDFKGRRGESAALWIYPEMKVQQVVLKRVSSVNENGHVEGFEEETVAFPIPALAHFVGASSAQ